MIADMRACRFNDIIGFVIGLRVCIELLIQHVDVGFCRGALLESVTVLW